MSSRLQAHWGFTRMPFGRSLAPSMLHRHDGHAEAVARIGWCVDQHALGVITGEVGAGKTVAVRAATAALDTSRHVVIYLPNPSVGVRGMLHHIVSALGQVPSFYTATLVPQAAARWPPNTPNAAAPPWSCSTKRTCWTTRSSRPIRMLTNHDMDSGAPFAAAADRATHPAAAAPSRRARRPGPADHRPLRPGRHERRPRPATTSPTTSRSPAASDTLFSDDAITLIHNASRGYPRAVNNLAVNALTAAFARKASIVDEKAARIAISETGAD